MSSLNDQDAIYKTVSWEPPKDGSRPPSRLVIYNEDAVEGDSDDSAGGPLARVEFANDASTEEKQESSSFWGRLGF
jgi:hypothetical protein